MDLFLKFIVYICRGVGHELGKSFRIPRSIVRGWVLPIVKVDERRITFDLVLITDGTRLGAV